MTFARTNLGITHWAKRAIFFSARRSGYWLEHISFRTYILANTQSIQTNDENRAPKPNVSVCTICMVILDVTHLNKTH
jgi:hypothetical protein